MRMTAVAVGLAALLAACAYSTTNTGYQETSGLPSGGDGTAAHPLVPVQFAPIPDGQWTLKQPLVGRERECRDGKIKVFDCKNISLLAFLPDSLIGGPQFTALQGWTDPATGRDFVIASHKTGISFLEITDPVNPRYLGTLPVPTGATPSRWHDIKIYEHHAFIVSDDAGPHGMQIVDLTQLPALRAGPVTLRETAHYDRVGSVHTLAVDTASGFAYLTGANGAGETCGGGLHMVDIHEPTAPTFAGCYAETLGGTQQGTYVHETQCVVYHGPDRRYRDHQICMDAAATALGIVDVTDKRHPQAIGVGRYPKVAYAHQGRFTEDQRYFFLGDEYDEDGVHPTRTIVFDVTSLGDPVVAKEFYGTTIATDHNLYVSGHYVYQSNYWAGLRVLDIAHPADPQEVAYFDTTPRDGEPSSVGPGGGSWDNFPFFKNGVVAVSSFGKDSVQGTGIFILRFRPK